MGKRYICKMFRARPCIRHMKQIIFILNLIILLFAAYSAQSQEAEEAAHYAGEYLDSRTGSLEKYMTRSGRLQQRVLKRLKRKEARMLSRLAARDSAAYYAYIGQGVSYDSIATLSQDTTALQQFAKGKNRTLDSLKGVQRFLEGQTARIKGAGAPAGKIPEAGAYTARLDALQEQLNAQQKIDELLRQRTASLEQMARANKLDGIVAIQKQVYYAGEKMKAFRNMADDPDETEEAALEYLQGTQGFAEAFSGNSKAFGGLGNNATAEDLQRMGYQTKSQVNAMLQQKLGNNLGQVQQQMSAQVQQYQEQLNGLTGKIGEAKRNVEEGKRILQEAKQAKDQLSHMQKPAFRKNPERGKPFWQRLEPQYNFQTSRASPDGLRPAMLELGASLAFKHTPRLSYGLGFGLSAGLGKDWQNIRFSYEGIIARAYADWLWQYGFSLQAGYERAFRPSNRPYLPGQQDAGSGNNPDGPSSNALRDAFGGQQQTAYAGIMKRYRINSKWNGTFLVGYNFLWREEALRSPFLLRFGWGK